MSAQTLKAPRAGAQEAQSAAAELPEKLFPAKTTLAGALADYQKASLDMEEARGHLARAESDEQTALNNLELSDAEVSDRVARAQRSRGIYSARMASREAAVSKALKELKAALYPACNEYANLCMKEKERRRAIIGDRIAEAGQLIDNFLRVLDPLLDYSRPVDDIRKIEIASQSALFLDNAAAIVGLAKRVLEGHEALAIKQKEQI